MGDFKIQVESPEHSKEIQEWLFKEGCHWGLMKDKVLHTRSKYLFVENSTIYHGNLNEVFEESELPERWFLDGILYTYDINPVEGKDEELKVDDRTVNDKSKYPLDDHSRNLLRAIADDKVIQELDSTMDRWVDVCYDYALERIANGSQDLMYMRVKPETIMIGDVEVPKPFDGELQEGQRYFTVELGGGGGDNLICERINYAVGYGEKHVKIGIVHLTKQDAITHTKALIKISRGVV